MPTKRAKPSRAHAHAAGRGAAVPSVCDPAPRSPATTEELALRGMEAFCASVTLRGRGRGTVYKQKEKVDGHFGGLSYVKCWSKSVDYQPNDV